jgi:hypothetical protein
MTWYETGYPEPAPITKAQGYFLKARKNDIVQILTPGERVAMELMGYEDYVQTLSKYEASMLIGRIKGELIVGDIRRGEGEEAAKILKELKGRRVRDGATWWDTGLSKEDGVGVRHRG